MLYSGPAGRIFCSERRTVSYSVVSAKGSTPEQRLVLGQIAIYAKSNEITAVPKPLRMLTLIVNTDTLNCQREISSRGRATMPLTLKANRGTL